MKKYLYSLIIEEKKGIIESLIRTWLLLLSFVYYIIVKILAFAFEKGLLKRRLPRKVISIGNITLGGSGKTPLVQMIVNLLKENNKRSAVLTRGYMSEDGEHAFYSDEAKMLELELSGTPILVYPNRFKAAKQHLKKYDTDCFVLDDGFQQWRLHKDLNIVAIDMTRPFGNGFLLPRGTLREPISALRRSDVIILTKSDMSSENLDGVEKKIKKANSSVSILHAVHSPVCFISLLDEKQISLNAMKEKDILAVTAISDPKSFERSLINIGCSVKDKIFYPDHYVYSKSDVMSIITKCEKLNITNVITTQKDAMKFNDFINLFNNKFNLFYLKIKISIVRGKDELISRINNLF